MTTESDRLDEVSRRLGDENMVHILHGGYGKRNEIRVYFGEFDYISIDALDHYRIALATRKDENVKTIIYNHADLDVFFPELMKEINSRGSKASTRNYRTG